MIRKYLLTLLSIAGLALATYTVLASARPSPVAQPVAPAAAAPFSSYVAGSGIIEASTRNIAIGTYLPGVVARVFIEAGDRVKAGDPLFQIDARPLQAELASRQAALTSAVARLTRLQAQPRAEDVPPAEARLAAAEASLADARAQLDMWISVTDQRAVSQQEMDRIRYAAQVAEARLAEARAQLDLLRAGAWKPDVDIARTDVAAAQAQLEQTQVELDRLTVRAPIDGQVLQLNVRAGEYAAAGDLSQPLVLLGSVDVLQVRVDVDENDAWRVAAGARAQAFLRGNSQISMPLAFVRFEPYVVPKRSLTGSSTERVDTRVLQLLYSFDRGDLPVYVGQQVDVFIDAPPISASRGAAPAASAAADAPSTAGP